MSDLNEYRVLRDWLHGTKPAPAGRTWRRTLVVAASLPLSSPTQEKVYQTSLAWGQRCATLPNGLNILMHAALSALVIAGTLMIAELVCSVLR